ncbi:glycoside hydrolase [Nonomuraea sp. NPDC050556]|uniref:glycoside hydrolase n=1 Tax=Nonomuraea sp. NPDC050556 TaxID=3364369 RepID=UPI0037B171C3
MIKPLLSLLLAVNPVALVDPAAMVVDPNVRYQTVEGWGTSLAWWANVVGGWSDAARSQVADALFDPVNGLGLNIVRYNLGGGPNPEPQAGYRVGADIPTFMPASGTWDWNADANQRWVAQAAKARGVTLWEGFANSPPAWMTVSNCTGGHDDGNQENLKAGLKSAYASYLAETAKHFRDAWGITFRTVSPFNEPNATWWHCSNNQEGNRILPASQNEIVKLLDTELKARGLTGTSVAGPEEYTPADSLASYTGYDATAKAALGQINTHTYQTGGAAPLRRQAEVDGKRLWMSEVGVGGTATHNHSDFSSALELSAKIRSDLLDLRPAAWVYWQAVENEQLQNNWGLMHANFTGAQQSWKTRQYWAMANYSRFIKPGYQIVDLADSQGLAAFHQASGTLVIVTANQGTSSRPVSYDLSRFLAVGGTAQPYRTSVSEDLVRQADVPIANGVFTTSLPPQSITTFVVPPGTPGPNLLANPGFETGSLSGWQAEWNPSRAWIETSYPHEGAYDASLHPTSTQDVAVYQTFTAPRTGTYTLKGFAATNASGVQLGVDVAGTQAGQRTVEPNIGYLAQNLKFTATAGQLVKVWYYAERSTGWATLDRVSVVFG